MNHETTTHLHGSLKPAPEPPTPAITRTPSCYVLPPLELPDVGETIIPLHVLPLPTADQGALLIWTVDERPSRKVRYGQLVSMRTPESHTGIGMLTAVSELRRYWITWTVSSDSARCKICIPTSWTVLSGVEAVAHEKHYITLPSSPPPHREDPIWRLPSFVIPYPYKTDTTPDEKELMHKKLEAITMRKWQWGVVRAGKDGKKV
ncbi:hypothetical protein FOMPIDRAFT_1055960 [Fomitopsis schrenkii]|uniref:Uncharacterized protein n=1 Tax=Fomitopsis schrenkii TaxID=2126942 RepID=S8DIM6_FOMSC|nr:hypothetical protein FOMPIDRAFT_1055960 [Fomitopsis schrenkii]